PGDQPHQRGVPVERVLLRLGLPLPRVRHARAFGRLHGRAAPRGAGDVGDRPPAGETMIGLLLTACANTTAGALVQVPFVAGGADRTATGTLDLDTIVGWHVALTAAEVSIGPFYFD